MNESGLRLLAIQEAKKAGDVGALVKHLNDPEHRDAAARALGQLQAEEAVPALLCLLSDRFVRPRRAATVALGRIGSMDATGALVRTLERDESDQVRAYAASSLGRIGDSESVPGLIKALQDPSHVVRVSAIEALGRIGDPSALEPLDLARSGEGWLVRRQIRKATRSIRGR